MPPQHYETLTFARIATIEANVVEIYKEIGEMKAARKEMNMQISVSLGKLDDRTRMNEKVIWLATGALAALQIIIAFLK